MTTPANASSPPQPGKWIQGPTPPNVSIGQNTIITGEHAFKRFRSVLPDALVIGSHCTMDGVHFNLGEQARMRIGDYSYFTNAILLCELEVVIGRYVVIGWNTTITDTDFHPIAPADRVADAIACSPLGKGRPRPKLQRLRVLIDDDVWIGPSATILKGVHIGAGAFIEAGSMVTRDVPSRARVLGNPAEVIGTVP